MKVTARDLSKNQTTAGQVVLSWLAVFVWAALIYYFSAMPGADGDFASWEKMIRIPAHAGEFGILGFLVWRALRQHRLREPWAIATAAVLSLLAAVTDEYHQSLVPHREASVWDVAVDFMGIAAMVAASYYLKKTRLEKD